MMAVFRIPRESPGARHGPTHPAHPADSLPVGQRCASEALSSMGLFVLLLVLGATTTLFALTYAVCRVCWRPTLALRVSWWFVVGCAAGALFGVLIAVPVVGIGPNLGSTGQVSSYIAYLSAVGLVGGIGLVRLCCRHPFRVRIGSRHPIR